MAAGDGSYGVVFIGWEDKSETEKNRRRGSEATPAPNVCGYKSSALHWHSARRENDG